MAIPVYIIANQRSGTNFLRNLLVSTGEFTDLNEIFQSNEPAVFWDFYQQVIQENPEVARPSKKNREYLFDRFVQETISPIETRYALVDLKYNTTHNLNCEFQPPSEAPLIFDLIKRHSCYVVHLIRENSLENYISNMLANQTQQYCVFNGDEIKAATVKLSPRQTLLEIQKCQQDIDSFRRHIEKAQYDNVIEFGYSELSRLNQADEAVQDKIREFFSLETQANLAIRTRKIAKSPSEVVTNYKDEILPLLLSSPYARFAY